MNTRKANPSVAESVVGESLGINLDDLGSDRSEDSYITDTDDDLESDGDDEDQTVEQEPSDEPGSDDDGLDTDPALQQPDPRREQQRDDLSVSHTQKKDEFSVAKFKTDKKGNIVNEAGKIVANAGREARLFTTLHKTRGELNTVQSTARGMIEGYRTRLQKAIDIGTRVAKELETVRAQGNPGQRAGLSDTELNGAIELASMYKRDKVGAIKMMLTKAHASGIDLTSLGLQPGGFDTNSLMTLIQQEIGKAVQPIQQVNQRETDQQRLVRERAEAEEAATEQLNTFLFQNPEAQRYLPAIRKIYERPEYQNMSLNEVWLNIQLNLLKGSRKDQSGERRQQQSPNPQRQRRLPDGRSHLGGEGPLRDQQTDSEMADVGTSYEDIVKSVLKRTG